MHASLFHLNLSKFQIISSRHTIPPTRNIDQENCNLGACRGASVLAEGCDWGVEYRSNYVRSPAPRSWKWTTECWNVDAASTGDPATTSSFPEHVSAEFKPNCKTLFVWCLPAPWLLNYFALRYSCFLKLFIVLNTKIMKRVKNLHKEEQECIWFSDRQL